MRPEALGGRRGSVQCRQVAQLPPAQDPHPPPFPLLVTRRLAPPSLLMAANLEIIRWAAGLAQAGQSIGLSNWLIGRSTSKGAWQLSQKYS